MSAPIDPPPRQPVPNQPGAGRLDEPGGLDARRPVTDPVPVDAGTPNRPAPGFDERGRVKKSRFSEVWIGLIATAIFLILLIVFIAQNSHKVGIHFFGWYGQFSLALTILISAVVGVVLVAVPGTVRMAQLRRALRKNGPGRS